MLLHMGADQCVALDKLLLVINARGMQPRARAYIERAKREKRYIACDRGVPKSYVVAEAPGGALVYGTMISSGTLEQRWRQTMMPLYAGMPAWNTKTGEAGGD